MDDAAFGEEALEQAEAQLGKSLKPRHVEMITIGGIIGAGLFVGSSASIAAVGPAVVLSYSIAGAIILLVMRMLSEMAVAVPGVRSFTEFTRVGLGNWAGFLSGWLYWYFWVIVIAIESIAGAVIIQGWLPFLPTWVIGVTLLALLTGVNLLSTKSYGEFEFWLSSLKVAAIVTFICLALGFACGVNPAHVPTFSNLVAHGGFFPKGGIAVLSGVTTVIFALVGAEIATVAAAESAEPARVIAKMTSSVALRILLFYVGSLALAMAVVPWNEIEPGKSPFTLALVRMAIPGAGTIMSAIVLTAVLSCLNSGLYVSSRILFSLAAMGDAPQALVRVNARKVPARAILVASVFGYGALAASILSPQLVFSFLANASGAIMLIVYAMIAFAQIRLRRRLEASAPERLVLRMWLFPGLSYATIALIAVVLVVMAITPAHQSEFFSSLVAAALVMILFVLFRRQKKAAIGHAPG